MRFARCALALGLCLLGCDAPEPPESTGGTDEPAGECGRGLVVVHSDNQLSTNVSLMAFDGRALSRSFLSSASSSSGLSSLLSGDVAVPSSVMAGNEIVLLDRYPASVLTWVEVATARVRAQLAVGTRTNPHDYVPLSERKAYVTRYEAWDGIGDDIAILDPTLPAITGSIELAPALGGQDPGFRATPGRALFSNGRVLVVLEATGEGFEGSAPSRVIAIDPDSDQIVDALVLHGVHGCSALALAPDESEIALGCTGSFDRSSDPDPATSFVVRVSISAELRELERRSALELGDTAFSFGLDYVSGARLVATRFGRENAEPDTLIEIELGAGPARELLSGTAFASLGDVRCAARCGVCVATDAERGVLHRFEVGMEGIGARRELVVDTLVGHPPRWIGRF
jgi:hypothetical protein